MLMIITTHFHLVRNVLWDYNLIFTKQHFIHNVLGHGIVKGKGYMGMVLIGFLNSHVRHNMRWQEIGKCCHWLCLSEEGQSDKGSHRVCVSSRGGNLGHPKVCSCMHMDLMPGYNVACVTGALTDRQRSTTSFPITTSNLCLQQNQLFKT